MVLTFLYERVWLAVALWLLVYTADHGLTIWGAREYRRGPMERIVFEGSYELNPMFQKDVDDLTFFGRRFWILGVVWAIVLVIAWLVSSIVFGGSALFELVLGALVLLNMTQVVGHIPTISQFRALSRGPAFEGRMEFSRRYLERQAGASMMAFALLYLLISLLLQSYFALGGALYCGLLGWRTYFFDFPTRGQGDSKIAETVRGNLHPACWHPDPTKRHGYRYWDGERWTDHVADDGVAGEDGYRL